MKDATDMSTREKMLKLLRKKPLEDIVKAVQHIIDATWGYRHWVALADSVLWGTPVENVKCMVQSARDYYRSRRF